MFLLFQFLILLSFIRSPISSFIHTGPSSSLFFSFLFQYFPFSALSAVSIVFSSSVPKFTLLLSCICSGHYSGHFELLSRALQTPRNTSDGHGGGPVGVVRNASSWKLNSHMGRGSGPPPWLEGGWVEQGKAHSLGFSL